VAATGLKKLARTAAMRLGLYQRLRGQDTSRFKRSISEARQTAGEDEMSRLFYAHEGRFVQKWGHYLPIYDRHLAPFRGAPVRILEIGVSQGGSLQLWRKYLGPEAVIFGIDNEPSSLLVDDLDLSVRVGSQGDPTFLRKTVEEMGGIDIVIDDGSHRAHHQRTSFETLFPLLTVGGLYICEDLLTAYWPGVFGGGLRKPGTFIEVCKSLVDRMNSWYYGNKPAPEARTVGAVHFYNAVVVIEKAANEEPFFTDLGRKTFDEVTRQPIDHATMPQG
jgi:cephalosporin hydroxylase